MKNLTKICSKCGTEKPLSDFHKDRTAVMGHKPSCKECTKKYSADYAIRKSDELKARQKRVGEKRKELNKPKIELAKKQREEYWNNLTHRVCCKCKIKKPITEFRSRGDRPDRYRASCIDCCKIKEREYNVNYWENNKDYMIEKNKKWRENNKEKVKQSLEKYRKEHMDYFREYSSNYRKDRKSKDLSFKILCNTKRRILIALRKQSASKSDSTFNLTGLSGKELSEYLLSLGYNPEIHHVDHYLPLARFDLNQVDHQMVAFYYLNLQPLPAKENYIKKDSLPDNWQEKIYQICEVRNINPEPIIKHIQAGVKC